MIAKRTVKYTAWCFGSKKDMFFYSQGELGDFKVFHSWHPITLIYTTDRVINVVEILHACHSHPPKTNTMYFFFIIFFFILFFFWGTLFLRKRTGWIWCTRFEWWVLEMSWSNNKKLMYWNWVTSVRIFFFFFFWGTLFLEMSWKSQ